MLQPMTAMRGQINVRLVDIPTHASRGVKGKTKYDDYFSELMKFKKATQVPEDEFDAIRKAAFRYLKFNRLEGKVSVKQKKDSATKTYLMWFKEADHADR